MSFQRFVLGTNVVETESQLRKIKLGAYLILIYIGVDLFFFIVNLFNPEGDPASLLAGFLISLFCLVLLRARHINLAVYLHLLRCNTFAYYFSSIDTDPIQTGSFLYFIPSSLGALAVFGYRERWKGIGFTLLSFILFLKAIFKPAEFSPDQAHFYFIVSFSIVLVISLLIILFFDQMVNDSERRMEEKNRELTKANEELDRFVYSASHDLRSPLSSVAGLIDLSGRDVAGRDEYLSLMNNRVNAMDKLIQDIIQYSKNKRTTPISEKVNVYALFKEVMDWMKYVDVNRNLSIQLTMNKDLHVHTDPDRLRVVLHNLVSNSIRYADPNKDQLIVQVSGFIEDNTFTFIVEDNGMGIAEDQQEKIFQMFYRASEKADGSGLGLYIVKEAVTKLNGTVECRSAVGNGSRFTVTIPLA